MSDLPKRKWCYVQQPMDFDIGPCTECGSHKIMWSEFEKHIWCPTCSKDYIPEHNGIFDGPILMHTAGLLGVRFDRVILVTETEPERLDRFDTELLQWESEKTV